jgi:polysaccharide export outer membrane protein
MTVQKAVAITGGFTARARKGKVQVSRQVNGWVFTQMVPLTWSEQPGDTIRQRTFFLKPEGSKSSNTTL